MMLLYKKFGRDYGVLGSATVGYLDNVAMWPGKAFPATIGSSSVSPLVTAVSDDIASAYTWSTEVKLAFPKSAFMTWQDFRHGVGTPFASQSGTDSFDECHGLVLEYLKTGKLPMNG